MQQAPLKVAFQSPCWPEDARPNGIATYVGTITRSLASLGVDCHVLAAEVPGGTTPESVIDLGRFARAPSKARRVLHRAAHLASRNYGIQLHLGETINRGLAELERRAPVDLFELEESFGLGSVVRRQWSKPLVVRLHGPWCVVGPALGTARDKEFFVRWWAEGRAIREADAVSSPSQDALDRVRETYRVTLPEAAVIPNPAPVVPDSASWRYEACEPRTILFVGRFDRVKGADVVLRAFRRVATKLPDAQLLFAGPDVGLREGARQWTLPEYLSAHLPPDVRARVQVLGPQSQAQLAELRQRAAVTVVASRYETFGMTVLEALAVGSPLITSLSGGIREIVRPGQNCLSFHSENVEELAAGLLQLLENPELSQRLAREGRAHCTTHYSPDAVARRMLDFYGQVLDGRKHRV